MKLAVKIKLNPTEEQYQSLLGTMKEFNNACNYISKYAFENKVYSKFKIQDAIYYDVKERFKLSSQMIIRAIAKVAAQYKRDKSACHQFRDDGAIQYDKRVMSFKGLEIVNLWTVDGRQNIEMVITGYQKRQLSRGTGQADLVLVDGVFYLLPIVDIEEPPQTDTNDFIGIDLGIVKTAVTSFGHIFDGELIEKVRQKYFKVRRSLQKKKTKSAKRRLKKIGRREARFRRNVNHKISKEIVKVAKGTSKGIAVENLQGIRKQTVRKRQRARHHSWGFHQLQTFLEYKCKLNGIPFVKVNPKDTSKACSRCGYVSASNRQSQSDFQCRACGFAINADLNAAINIAQRAAGSISSYVSQPYVVELSTASPRL